VRPPPSHCAVCCPRSRVYARFCGPSYVMLMVFLLFYLWAVVGVIFLSGNDPVNFGNLHLAFLALWRSATGDDWTDMMYTAFFGCTSTVFGGGADYGGRDSLCEEQSSAMVRCVLLQQPQRRHCLNVPFFHPLGFSVSDILLHCLPSHCQHDAHQHVHWCHSYERGGSQGRHCKRGNAGRENYPCGAPPLRAPWVPRNPQAAGRVCSSLGTQQRGDVCAFFVSRSVWHGTSFSWERSCARRPNALARVIQNGMRPSSSSTSARSAHNLFVSLRC